VEIFAKLDRQLVAPLQQLFPFSIRLFVKTERRDIFRNRYLQTEQAIIAVRRLRPAERRWLLRDNIFQVRNHDFDRLAELRRLRDYEIQNVEADHRSARLDQRGRAKTCLRRSSLSGRYRVAAAELAGYSKRTFMSG